jgi:hypothetical protein
MQILTIFHLCVFNSWNLTHFGLDHPNLHHLCVKSRVVATNALVQDEAVQVILGMNQKHILFPCPRIFQPAYLPQNFPLLPTSSFLPTCLTSFCAHSIVKAQKSLKREGRRGRVELGAKSRKVELATNA